ncbi:MAG: tripartite tricarboxylate transporter substrate binding protein [Burkholderiaceae bacterium]
MTVGLLGAASALLPSAMAQSGKTVTIVVPFAAGGGHDFTARLLAERLTQRMSQQVIVENRAGANGMIGAEHVAKSAPDGTTILLASPAEVVISQSLYKSMRYDPLRDLAPVTLAGVTPLVIAAHPSVQAKTLEELIALAKRPGSKLGFGTAGTGSSQHLAGAWLNSLAGIDLIHVPYKGAAPAVNDLLGGQIPLAIVGMAPLIAHIKAGKLNAIAVTTKQRVGWFPSVPAVAEAAGLKDFEVSHWMGVLVPAKTPPDIVARLNREFVAVLEMPDVKQTLLQQGVEPVGNTPQQFGAFLASEQKKFAELVKLSGVTPE